MEYRKICNVCHNVWCYSDEDVKENAKNALSSTLASIGSIASGLVGTRYDMYELGKASNNAANKIKDFTKCPYCNSTDIKNITEEELKKININNNLEKARVTINSNASVDTLIKRIELFMVDEEWEKADAYCDQTLDIEPENGYLWLLKLLIECKWKLSPEKKVIFNDAVKKLEECKYYDKVEKFSKGNKELEEKIDEIKKEISEIYYINATEIIKKAKNINEYKKAMECLKNIKSYKDSENLIDECYSKIFEIEERDLRASAKEKSNSEEISDLQEAKKIYEKHKEWDNSEEQINAIKEKIKEIEHNEEIKSKKKKKNIIISIIIAIICIIIIMAVIRIANYLNDKKQYEEAIALYNEQKYEDSIKILKNISHFKDSKELIKKEKYESATKLLEEGDSYGAYETFKELRILYDYSNSLEMETESITQYYIEKFGNRDSEEFFVENIDAYEKIEDEEKLKNIFKGIWYIRELGESYYKNLGEKYVFYDNGTVEREGESTYWDIANNSLYFGSYKPYGDIKSDYYKMKVYKLIDGVYLMVNNNYNTENVYYIKYIFISDDSQCKKRIEDKF